MQTLRLAYVALFLIALLAVFEVWSQVGGQSHLDLLPWYTKLLLGGSVAFAVVQATMAAVVSEQPWNARTLKWAAILIVLLIGCGLASNWAHQNLESDESDDDTTASMQP